MGELVRVARLSIERFRGVKSATLHFTGHTLFVGSNNVGKSTICEALDLVLGPDRLSSHSPPIDEFDFYNAQYLKPPEKEGEESTPIKLRVEVVLIEPSEAILAQCGGHVEVLH